MNKQHPRSHAPGESRVVHSDSEIHSGAPVFVGTRVPVHTFLDYIEGGHTLDEFVDHFPSVRREQAVAFLRQATDALLGMEPKAVDQAHPTCD
jgi:uncharacterized protein (DUF433 family)